MTEFLPFLSVAAFIMSGAVFARFGWEVGGEIIDRWCRR